MQAEATYLKLSQQILEQYADLPLQRPLPSEHELGALFGVNRQTIRAALEELERRWLIRRVKGSGTFRTRRYEYRIGPDIAPSFTATVRASGGDPRTENAKPVTRPANASEREILGLPANAQVTVLERVRFIDGAAVSTATSVLPSARVPRLAAVIAPDDSLDAVLRRHYGYTPVRQWSQSRLASPPAQIAEVLRLRGRPPQILLRGLVSCSETGQKLEYVESFLRPDVFDVVTEVGKW
ncbi:GntR family transcriptional regulator [Paeniglutamicibacter terrestris]|uniref:GntR family transcriptional regulator n=1 Tax=Paeniglutamicibacter terrestris TaxID=2723403 RepID=A0ABX1G1Q8_9MICC|nr:GntR family transcriptional regulator [Paeniglutamicibacter terrestris]ASN37876.1 GntR family transcriptional regulator [Arthrobacter sp. 7749]NKG19928.1 GntR family transcriptional regulator [Paeniglutamicibacter terrestris]